MKEKDLRIRLLSERADAYFKEQPELKTLNEKLLSFGGDMVCFSGTEEDLDKILSRGLLLQGLRSKLMKGRNSQCHSNSSRLWSVNKEKVKIVTGYALSKDEDGLRVWRCHTWAIENSTNRLIETTIRRKLYFGYILDEDESHEFYYMNY